MTSRRLRRRRSDSYALDSRIMLDRAPIWSHAASAVTRVSANPFVRLHTPAHMLTCLQRMEAEQESKVTAQIPCKREGQLVQQACGIAGGGGPAQAHR